MEDQDGLGSAAKSRKRRIVALAQNANDENQHSVVIGSCLSERSVRRSGLLAGIENTEGLASLPGHLSPEDVRLWETAAFVKYAITSEDVVTVFKVAEALGDPRAAEWEGTLADRALRTKWKLPGRADDMMCTLLRLLPHILSRVLSECVARKSLSSILDAFPATIHATLIAAAAATPLLKFSISHIRIVLPALLSAAVPSPGLRKLRICNIDATDRDGDTFKAATTGALLAQAVSAHDTITSISLPAIPVPPRWLRTFSACLAPSAGPCLAALDMCADAHPDGCSAVSSCLALLPALTLLEVNFCLPDTVLAVEVSLSSYALLAGAPASLPHLQKLTISEGKKDQDMDLEEGETSCIPQFLAALHAPAMTGLHMSLHSGVDPLRVLVAQVASFSALQDITISGNLLWESDNKHAFCDDPASTDSAVAVPPLPALRSLDVQATCPLSLATIAALLADLAASCLNCLKLSPPESNGWEHDEERTRSRMAHALGSFWKVLRRCTGLQTLTIDCLGCPQGATAEDIRILTEALAQALAGMSHLTRLRLGAIDAADNLPLVGGIFGATLGTLSTLVELDFDVAHPEYGLTFAPMQAVIAACIQLPSLRDVGLRIAGVTAAHVEELVRAGGALTTVRVFTEAFSDDEFEGARDELHNSLQARYPGVSIDMVDPKPDSD